MVKEWYIRPYYPRRIYELKRGFSENTQTISHHFHDLHAQLKHLTSSFHSKNHYRDFGHKWIGRSWGHVFVFLYLYLYVYVLVYLWLVEMVRLEVDFCSASSASASSQRSVGNTFQEFKVAKIVFRAEQFQLGALPLSSSTVPGFWTGASYLCIVDSRKWLLLLPVKAWEILQSCSNTQIHNFTNTQI